jgi:hypothetical protein
MRETVSLNRVETIIASSRIEGREFEKSDAYMIADPNEQQIPPLRCAPVGMTDLWMTSGHVDNVSD